MFNLADYETVEDRLEKFWEKYPDGRIETEVIEAAATRFIVKALLYRTEADARSWTSGLAFENVTERGVNATSALENCETSAIGRALANAGFATKGKRASREEMSKVAVRQPSQHLVCVIDDWENFVTTTPPEPVKLGEGVELLADKLGASVLHSIPKCSHGDRIVKDGTSKAGKPYRGWVCTAPRDHQCEALWMKIDSKTGEWHF